MGDTGYSCANNFVNLPITSEKCDLKGNMYVCLCVKIEILPLFNEGLVNPNRQENDEWHNSPHLQNGCDRHKNRQSISTQVTVIFKINRTKKLFLL